AATVRTNQARIEHRPARLRAPLIGQLTLVEMGLIDRERRLLHRRGAPPVAGAFCRCGCRAAIDDSEISPARVAGCTTSARGAGARRDLARLTPRHKSSFDR